MLEPADAGGQCSDGRALPPLIISEGEIDELLRKFGKALDETADALSH